MADFRIEKKCLKQGFSIIAGVDEVGRGALFGPVVAVALCFPPIFFRRRRPAWIKKVNDSKLLSPTKRVGLVKDLLGSALSLGVGLASNLEIDEKNIYQASELAMRRAVSDMTRKPDIVLVDGYPLKGVSYSQIGVCHGDRQSLSIAAASIVAKVFRDGLMELFDSVFQGYGLAKHKGYGTAEHFRVILEKGPTCLHRRSFNLRVRERS